MSALHDSCRGGQKKGDWWTRRTVITTIERVTDVEKSVQAYGEH